MDKKRWSSWTFIQTGNLDGSFSVNFAQNVKRMKAIRIFIICLILTGATQAQTVMRNHYYQTAVGFKYHPTAITVKQALFNQHMVEGLLYFYKGARITGLYEFHRKFKNSNSFRWYVGPGVHVQFNDDGSVNGGNNYMGLDAVIGIDWKLKGIPLNISADWQPSFDFVDNGNNFKGGFGGISFRYVFD